MGYYGTAIGDRGHDKGFSNRVFEERKNGVTTHVQIESFHYTILKTWFSCGYFGVVLLLCFYRFFVRYKPRFYYCRSNIRHSALKIIFYASIWNTLTRESYQGNARNEYYKYFKERNKKSFKNISKESIGKIM